MSPKGTRNQLSSCARGRGASGGRSGEGTPHTSWFAVAHDQIREARGRSGPTVLTGVGYFITVMVTRAVVFEEANYPASPCDTRGNCLSSCNPSKAMVPTTAEASKQRVGGGTRNILHTTLRLGRPRPHALPTHSQSYFECRRRLEGMGTHSFKDLDIQAKAA